jgi:hypothetical protein
MQVTSKQAKGMATECIITLWGTSMRETGLMIKGKDLGKSGVILLVIISKGCIRMIRKKEWDSSNTHLETGMKVYGSMISYKGRGLCTIRKEKPRRGSITKEFALKRKIASYSEELISRYIYFVDNL